VDTFLVWTTARRLVLLASVRNTFDRQLTMELCETVVGAV